MQQPPTKPPTVVANNVWDHEYNLATQSLAESAHNGVVPPPTAHQETSFGRHHEAVADTQGGTNVGKRKKGPNRQGSLYLRFAGSSSTGSESTEGTQA